MDIVDFLNEHGFRWDNLLVLIVSFIFLVILFVKLRKRVIKVPSIQVLPRDHFSLHKMRRFCGDCRATTKHIVSGSHPLANGFLVGVFIAIFYLQGWAESNPAGLFFMIEFMPIRLLLTIAMIFVFSIIAFYAHRHFFPPSFSACFSCNADKIQRDKRELLNFQFKQLFFVLVAFAFSGVLAFTITGAYDWLAH